MSILKEGTQDSNFVLLEFLKKIPSVTFISNGVYENKNWWIKFTIDIEHALAWNVVQELGHIANYVSINERLPTIFYPVSPPPYMNGGPKDFLSWIIESKDPEFTHANMADWLEGRLPRPVEDESLWHTDEE